MKTFAFLTAAAAALCGLNGAHAYGPGLIDTLVQEHRESLSSALATDEATRALLSVRKRRPMLEILTLQQAEEAEVYHKHKKGHRERKTHHTCF